ncbi:MAG: DNA translocase FtsK [Clostridia bacterium]|nr:DNA translocase FtsK [Clostridia bacterium]
MATKKRGRPSSKKKTQTINKGNRQLYAIICFAVAIFSLFVVLFKGVNVWTNWLHNPMFSIFGITAYFYPFLLGAVAILLAKENPSVNTIVKVCEIAVLILFVGAFFSACSIPTKELRSEDFTFGKAIVDSWNRTYKFSGGVLGSLIGIPLCLWFGKGLAITTFVILILTFVMIITGTQLIPLFKAIAKPAKIVSEQATTVFRERSAKDENKPDNQKELKVIKGFDVDMEVDEPEKTNKRKPTIDEIGQKLVSTYNDEEIPTPTDEDEYTPVDDTDDIDEAIAAAREEAEQTAPERISVDFKKETDAVTNEISENIDNMPIYKFPPLSLLDSINSADSKTVAAELESTAQRLVDTLKSFGVETQVINVSRGPTVTRYELQPKAGVKISKITSLADDIALNLATAGVRIEAPIPNKAAVGIEVPNRASATVGIREVIESSTFSSSKSKLTVSMGKDIGGNTVVADIAKMPHGLIAGATGSGKSVCINSFIISLLYKASPDEVKLLMVDPKVVELGIYNGIPHLIVPVITEPRKAAGALGWAVNEMEQRYKMFADRDVRNIEGYNKLVESLVDEPEVKKMPRIVIIIDELADLMMTAPKEVEDSINRIAAKARAAGIHLLIATQRPSVNVVTGVIKANIPTRIAFAVSSHIDSGTILDCAGAEKLLGRGDMLFRPVGANKPNRIQGCFVSDEEVERVVEFVKSGGNTSYDDNVMLEIERQAAIEKQQRTGVPEEGANDDDPVLDEAIKVVVELGQASTSLLQRKLKLGYARAARIIDQMEERGIIGGYEGAKPRQVLITKDQLMEMQAGSDE